jgi:hypothetical protein
VSLAEQTLVQSVFFKRLVCPPDHPALQAAMIIGAFRLGILAETAAIP